ncbi:hypothetical protein EVG20_g3790 [Dentipellis fragilis]|uniref:Uncharacterized protein n=1 Tax=Dentipellis fragilis TaxID=205917 RepID=A0A4Y9Z1D6_9AGAM|nr:hypothetical protein EVG20_g3790 [Dentipellis fragilis]
MKFLALVTLFAASVVFAAPADQCFGEACGPLDYKRAPTPAILEPKCFGEACGPLDYKRAPTPAILEPKCFGEACGPLDYKRADV